MPLITSSVAAGPAVVSSTATYHAFAFVMACCTPARTCGASTPERRPARWGHAYEQSGWRSIGDYRLERARACPLAMFAQDRNRAARRGVRRTDRSAILCGMAEGRIVAGRFE